MKRILQVIALSMLVITSCTKEKNLPTASFDLTLSKPQAPAKVTLTNTSTNALSYMWETSDGRTSVETNPEFTFNQGGTYEIKLTAINAEGSSTASKSVVIEDAPKPVKMKIFSLDFVTWEPGDWDASGAPDVYFKIWSGNTLVYEEPRIDNIYTHCYWYFEPVIEVPTTSPLKVEVYDYDEEDSDDLIKSLNYDLPTFTSYPESLMIWENSIKIEMETGWIY